VTDDQQHNPRGRSRRFLSRYRLVLSALLHVVLFAFALFSAFLFAYDFKFGTNISAEIRYTWFRDLFLPLLLISLPIKIVVFSWQGQYRSAWRYVSIRDLLAIMNGGWVASALLLAVYFVLENGWRRYTGDYLIDKNVYLRQVVFPLDWVLTIAFVCGAKIIFRLYNEDVQGRALAPTEELRRILIVGAGDAGEALLREVLRQGKHRCVGILDESPGAFHGRIHGVEVLGGVDQLREVCISHKVSEVFIALPNATPKVIRGLVEQCEGAGVLFRTVPPVTELIEGRVTVSQVRDVEIADLLGRAQVELDIERIGEQLRGNRALVTGAGGSIGSEMCRQIAKFQPERLILVEQAENNLFEIDRELRARGMDVEVVPYVADIVDRRRLEAIFARERPSVVFHAAAHKHVPMMEVNPGEAIKNNVRGTATVADVAVATGVGRMVMISTDKAVNPTSIMGCTKRVAEMYVQGLSSRADTAFITVRFGNVLGSSGSVVPIFRQQIAGGGPVTVTHPEMTRYFMTIPEASQLVLQAGTMGRGGEIYILHMGEPVKIVDLARDMITLSGLRPGIDIEVVFSGIRPGEKLYEELMIDGEHVMDTAHPKIFVWRHREVDWGALRAGVDQLVALADTGTLEQIQQHLRNIVAEYSPGALPSPIAAMQSGS
jgi:FlaA1/EpsC-like NDP-sugar epimerase